MSSRERALQELVDDLAQTRIGATFNQYRDSDGDDATADAPDVRRCNLTHYLQARSQAPSLLVAEAAGWRGARYSGLCLYSERQIDERTTPYRRTSSHPDGWSEPSATVVQAAIRPWAEQVLLWNLLPLHPRVDMRPHSNRPPLRSELHEGARWMRRLIDILRPQHVGAIGRHAAAALGDGVPAVRHPSHGGALVCMEQLQTLLTTWFDGADVTARSGAGAR